MSGGPSQLPAMFITAITLVIIAYFSKNVLKTVDIIYKPKIDPWIRHRQKPLRDFINTCKLKNSHSCQAKKYEEGFKSSPMDKVIEDDEKYLEFLEQELETIKQIREAKLQSRKDQRDLLRYGEDNSYMDKDVKISGTQAYATCSLRQIFLYRDEL
ncbi:unnamed protein product [Lepeophtheirus salmonis]|uniref:(salmon louse) hypothetical protein n=1 Tax=Lepeophtheirus salmonis TaxID=72036 RepID=A0A7R8CE08_LEPSM|nr:unnamed protein product [Lepeophtheirus salmonis]CAF2753705.1 unnamed protein product [Lepeophtheirus salmonis]